METEKQDSFWKQTLQIQIPLIIQLLKLVPVSLTDLQQVFQHRRMSGDILIININVIESPLCFKYLLCSA